MNSEELKGLIDYFKKCNLPNSALALEKLLSENVRNAVIESLLSRLLRSVKLISQL